MITENLYPTASTYPQGDNSELTAEITNSWYSSVDGITIDSLESYWLGYIKKDNLPQDFKQGVLYVDNGKLVIKDCTDSANFPCGYVYHTNSGSANLQQNLYRNIDGAESWTANSSTRLINQLYPEYAGVGYTAANSYYGYALDIQVIGALYDMGGNLLNIVSPDYTLSENGSISFSGSRNSVKRAFDFLFNNATAQLHWRHNNTDYYFECTASDFESGSAFLTDTTEHMQLRAFITSYVLQSNVRLYSGNAQNFLTTFAAKISATYNNSHREYIRSYIGQYDEQEWWEYSNSDYSIKDRTAEDPYYAVGWGNDEIDVSEIERINAYTADTGVPYGYTEKTFMCRHRQSGRAPKCCFHHIVPIDSIQKHFSLAFRVDVSGILTPSYVANFTYATDVTSSNEFLARLKTGNLSDATFKNSLREWQYTDFQADDFDEDDIPPYEPEPEPGGDDTPGDEPQDLPHDDGTPEPDQDSRTLTAPSLFITQYILNYSQLQTIGTNLWQSWLDPTLEVWKNFYINFAQDTGTMDIGAVMNFIISLRVFPFDLAGMTTDYLISSNGVYMGTGHTNFCPGSIAVLNTVIGYLDCGTCVVKPTTPYNDFRDMYNCSVLCFLPYCGTVELTPAEVMGRTLHVKYHIDFQSGSCTALVKVVGDNGEYTVASKSGQIGFTLPMTATNAGQLSAQFARDATQAVSTIGGFFFDAVKSGSDNLMSLANAMISKPKAIETDSKGNKSLNFFDNNTFDTSTEIGRAGFNTAISLANQTLNMLSRSGIDIPMLSGGSGAESMMQPDTAFIQIRRGKYAKPKNYPHSQAHINGSSGKIRDFAGKFSGQPTYPSVTNKGLCKFTGVDSSGLTCHDDERAEILALLESGIYV